ncbi:unnamed protein product [Umbelopsis sp. WA50703]
MAIRINPGLLISNRTVLGLKPCTLHFGKNGLARNRLNRLIACPFSTSASKPQSSPECTTDKEQLVYSAPNAPTVKLLKMFSISSLGIASLSAPPILYFWDTPAIQAADINGYMFIGALVASTCSTGVLHKFLSPYVNQVYLHHSKNKSLQTISPNTKITLETLDLLARKKRTTIKLRDLTLANGSWLTWRIKNDAIDKQAKLGQEEYPQTKFWLDQRGGVGDLETMSKIVKVVNEEYKRGRLL